MRGGGKEMNATPSSNLLCGRRDEIGKHAFSGVDELARGKLSQKLLFFVYASGGNFK